MRYLGIVIAVVGVIAGIVFAKNKWTDNVAEHDKKLAFQKLRGDYLERVAWLRSAPDEKYRDEMQTFLRWYFKEVGEQLNKFGGNRKFDDYLQELDRKAASKASNDVSEYEGPSRSADKTSEKKAAFEYTMKQFELFKSGNYAPFWTANDKGLRLDVLLPTTANVAGESVVRMPVVAWGLPREDKVDDRGTRRVVTNGSFRFNWKLFDEKDKLVAEVPGEGGPDSRVDWPERYIRWFPPMVVFGHFDMPKLPPEVKRAELTFSISARSPSGGDINAQYLWKMDVPAEWKLGAGETWKGAQESIRPEEEINPQKKK
jgi:hypothetical protein